MIPLPFGLLIAVCAQDWSPLPLPELASPRPPMTAVARLADGSHFSWGAYSPPPGEAPPPRLPVATLVQVIEDDARARGTRLELHRGSPRPLARGDAAAIAGAREVLRDLEAAAEAFAIEIEAELVTRGGSAAAGASVSQAGWKAAREMASGETAVFGTRRARAFLWSFDVEVAADSGVAAPVPGSALTGATLHLRATRLSGGREVHLEGLLDLAELAGMESFDPATPDLGILQQPIVDVAQVAFAGVVASGSSLVVRLSGTGLPAPDHELVLRARTRPDPAPDAARSSGVLLLDLAYIAGDVPLLPAARPGAGLGDRPLHTAAAHTSEAVAPSAIAAALDLRSGSTPRWMRWTEDLLVLPRADGDLWREAAALVAGVESTRRTSTVIEVRAGGLAASFPVCSGSPARLLAGRERPWLVGYSAEIAPQTWMPSPDVQRAFDGIAIEIEPLDGGARLSGWVASTREPAVAAQAEAQLGRVQLLDRSLRADSWRLRAGGPEARTLAAPAPAEQAGPFAIEAVTSRCLAP